MPLIMWSFIGGNPEKTEIPAIVIESVFLIVSGSHNFIIYFRVRVETAKRHQTFPYIFSEVVFLVYMRASSLTFVIRDWEQQRDSVHMYIELSALPAATRTCSGVLHFRFANPATNMA